MVPRACKKSASPLKDRRTTAMDRSRLSCGLAILGAVLRQRHKAIAARALWRWRFGVAVSLRDEERMQRRRALALLEKEHAFHQHKMSELKQQSLKVRLCGVLPGIRAVDKDALFPEK